VVFEAEAYYQDLQHTKIEYFYFYLKNPVILKMMFRICPYIIGLRRVVAGSPVTLARPSHVESQEALTDPSADVSIIVENVSIVLIFR